MRHSQPGNLPESVEQIGLHSTVIQSRSTQRFIPYRQPLGRFGEHQDRAAAIVTPPRIRFLTRQFDPALNDTRFFTAMHQRYPRKKGNRLSSLTSSADTPAFFRMHLSA